VIVLNSEGLTPTESNTTYYGNYKMWPSWLSAGKITSITDADSPYSVQPEDWLILCDTSVASISVVLPDVVGIQGKHFVVKKTAASNQVTVTAGDGSINIDGSTTHTNNQNYGLDWFVANGNEYWIISSK